MLRVFIPTLTSSPTAITEKTSQPASSLPTAPPRCGAPTQLSITDLPPTVEIIINELSSREKALEKELLNLQTDYKDARENYSTPRWMAGVKKQLAQEPRGRVRSRGDVLLEEDDFFEDMLDSESVDEKAVRIEKIPVPHFFQMLQTKIAQLKKEREALYQYECLNLQLLEVRAKLLTAIRVAADAYCLYCNEVLERNKSLLAKQKAQAQKFLTRLTSGASLFSSFVCITFDEDQKGFVCQYRERLDHLTIPSIISFLNRAIGSLPLQETEDSAIARKQLLDLLPTDIFPSDDNSGRFAMSLTLEDNVSRIHTLSVQSELLQTKYRVDQRSPSGRYYSQAELDEKDIEKKEFKNLIQKSQHVGSVFEALKEKYDTELKDINDKIDDLTNASAIARINRLCNVLTQAKNTLERESKDLRGPTYASYQHFKKALADVVEKEATSLVDRQGIQTDFNHFKAEFGGETIQTDQVNALIKIDAVQGPLQVERQKGEALELSLVDILSRMNEAYRKEQLVKRVLKFLKDQVFSNENIIHFWHQQVSVFLGMGGQDVNVSGYKKEAIKVPHGAAFIIQRLAKVRNIDDLSFAEAASLLGGVKGENGLVEDGIKGILAKRKACLGIFNKRQVNTTQQMYNLAESILNVETLDESVVANFERKVQEGIVDNRNSQKVLRLRITPQRTTPIRTGQRASSRIASSPIRIPSSRAR